LSGTNLFDRLLDQVGQLKVWDRNYYNYARLAPHENVGIKDLAVAPGSKRFNNLSC